ncbi:hypothetical protein [Solibacillus sp. FSL K6-1523]|uniref:hypothetical protein n=1 Tax=Solibacillus sp. FSL K6-1523 TaxID=2921471 RepID=UPI0030F6D8F3
MNPTRELYISICLMQLVLLSTTTIFGSEWNGIAMWLCTGIFIVATAIFVSANKIDGTEK